MLCPVDAVRQARALPTVTLSEREVAAAVALIGTIEPLTGDESWLADEGAAEVAARAVSAAEAIAAGQPAEVTASAAEPVLLDPEGLLATLEASVAAVKADRGVA